jgi:hypothetical protein
MQTFIQRGHHQFLLATVLSLKELVANVVKAYRGALGAEFICLADSRRESCHARLASAAPGQPLPATMDAGPPSPKKLPLNTDYVRNAASVQFRKSSIP